MNCASLFVNHFDLRCFEESVEGYEKRRKIKSNLLKIKRSILASMRKFDVFQISLEGSDVARIEVMISRSLLHKDDSEALKSMKFFDVGKTRRSMNDEEIIKNLSPMMEEKQLNKHTNPTPEDYKKEIEKVKLSMQKRSII